MKMQKNALKIVEKLQKKGYIAYFAGGSVRDLLLNKIPKDFDIVTSAKPNDIERLFEKTIPVGKQFGVMLVILNSHEFHVSTFRVEEKYEDARRPSRVKFSKPKEDAKRRDFTINGIFYDPVTKKYIDYVAGQKDIQNKIIRFIGNPAERIKEDHLRILRAVRFKNNLGFKYDPETKIAVKQNARLIKTVSAERIRDELNKMLEDKSRAQAIEDLCALNILKQILPEVQKMKGIPQPYQFHIEGDVYQHTLSTLKHLPPKAPLHLAWALLLHDIGKPVTISYPKTKDDRIRFNEHVKASVKMSEDILDRLRFPRDQKELILFLINNHMILADVPKMREAKRRRFLADERFPTLLALHKADALGSGPQDLTTYKADLSLYKQNQKLLEEEARKPKPKRFLSGHDIIKFGLKPGPKIGKILKALEDAELEGKIRTKKEAARFARKMLVSKSKALNPKS